MEWNPKNRMKTYQHPLSDQVVWILCSIFFFFFLPAFWKWCACESNVQSKIVSKPYCKCPCLIPYCYASHHSQPFYISFFRQLLQRRMKFLGGYMSINSFGHTREPSPILLDSFSLIYLEFYKAFENDVPYYISPKLVNEVLYATETPLRIKAYEAIHSYVKVFVAVICAYQCHEWYQTDNFVPPSPQHSKFSFCGLS